MYRLELLRRVMMTALLTSVLSFGCGDDDGDDDDGPRDGGSQSDAGGTRVDGGLDGGGGDLDARVDGGVDATLGDAGRLTDTQISEILRLVNSAEIMAGMTANAKAMNAQVKNYAQSMIAMHMAAETRRNALNLSPAQSDLSASLMMAANMVQSELASLPAGTAFDVRYIESQITMHQMALRTVVDVLVPSAMAAALRSELATVQSEVMMHLTTAQQIRTALGDAGVADGGTADGGRADAGGMDSGG